MYILIILYILVSRMFNLMATSVHYVQGYISFRCNVYLLNFTIEVLLTFSQFIILQINSKIYIKCRVMRISSYYSIFLLFFCLYLITKPSTISSSCSVTRIQHMHFNTNTVCPKMFINLGNKMLFGHSEAYKMST